MVLVDGLRLLYESTRYGGIPQHDRVAFAAVLAGNAAVRQALYATTLLEAHGNPGVGLASLTRQFCRSQKDDVDGLLVRAGAAEAHEDRWRLLLGACVVVGQHGLSEPLRDRLERAIAAAGLPADQVAELQHWTRRAPIAPSPDPHPDELDRDATQANAAATEAAKLADARRRLTEEITTIRTGEAFGALHYLVGQMRQLPRATAARWGQSNVGSLHERFGPAITDAAMEGLLHWWRGWRPPLPSERNEPSSVEQGVVVGLTGLAVFAASGGDFAGLSPEDARTAAHYALREINGPPDWFPALLAAKPDEVGAVLKTEINAALEEGADDAT